MAFPPEIQIFAAKSEFMEGNGQDVKSISLQRCLLHKKKSSYPFHTPDNCSFLVSHDFPPNSSVSHYHIGAVLSFGNL